VDLLIEKNEKKRVEWQLYLISLTREFEHSEIIVSKQLRKPGLTIMLGKLLYLLQIRIAT